ncbi:uncharacterized protein STEHIDRAFT_51163, partial [Stereum hirsutum FP-91666 SS1]|uniref:uncharacterized protein n=1 Tax=Stereum hirsutum (strain FP-91666) TaxID=721885 RepID=UPI000440E7F2
TACLQLFEALEECHANAWLKWTGGCNQAKLDLNKCLHGDSVARAARNREDSKARQAKRDQAWKELHAND